MNKENKPLDLRDEILQEIEEKHIKMRPKWQFVLYSMVAILAGIVLWLTLIYVASFIVFILDYNGVLVLPNLGDKSWFYFLLSLPWLLIILIIILFYLLEYIVKRFSLSYRRPLIYSILITVFLIVVGTYSISKTSLHRALLDSAEKDRLPIAGPLYRRFGHPHFKNIHKGIIIELAPPDRFMLRNQTNELLQIIITPRTRLPRGRSFGVGDLMVVFGERVESSTVEAIGIQKIKN
jgi:hypothetical protein